jgi:hypothetical protein
MPLSVNVFVTLATQQHLEYHCKALMKHPITWRAALPPSSRQKRVEYGEK